MSAVISAQMLSAPTMQATVSGSRMDFVILFVLAVCMLVAIVASFRATRAAADAAPSPQA